MDLKVAFLIGWLHTDVTKVGFVLAGCDVTRAGK